MDKTSYSDIHGTGSFAKAEIDKFKKNYTMCSIESLGRVHLHVDSRVRV